MHGHFSLAFYFKSSLDCFKVSIHTLKGDFFPQIGCPPIRVIQPDGYLKSVIFNRVFFAARPTSLMTLDRKSVV